MNKIYFGCIFYISLYLIYLGVYLWLTEMGQFDIFFIEYVILAEKNHFLDQLCQLLENYSAEFIPG